MVTPDGTIPPSGNQVTFAYADFLQARDGRFVSHRIYWDNLTLMAARCDALRTCTSATMDPFRALGVADEDLVHHIGDVGTTTSGCGPSGLSTIPGRATKAAAHPAASAPATSHACAATRRTSPTSTPVALATARYGSGPGLSCRTLSADRTTSK